MRITEGSGNQTKLPLTILSLVPEFPGRPGTRLGPAGAGRKRIYIAHDMRALCIQGIRDVPGGVASFPGLSGEGGKAWGLLRAHAQKLPQNVVIAYYSNLSATFVSILSVKACERGKLIIKLCYGGFE